MVNKIDGGKWCEFQRKIKNYIHEYKIRIYIYLYYVYKGFPGSSADKESAMQEIPV